MKRMLVLLLVSLMATSALATIDPDENMIGVYFDGVTADQNCMTSSLFVPFQAFVVVTNVTQNVSGVEFGYTRLSPDGGVFAPDPTILPAGGLDIGGAGNSIIGFASPITPTNGNVLIATWGFTQYVAGSLEFFIFEATPNSIPGSGLPVMAYGEVGLQNLGLSTGAPELGVPVATVNGDCPVPNEDISFGSVKSLFR